LQYGTSSSTYLGAQPAFGWSYNNQFFGDNSMNGIALNAQGNLINASALLRFCASGAGFTRYVRTVRSPAQKGIKT